MKEKILLLPPVMVIFDPNDPCPRHGIWIRGADEDGDTMTEFSEFSAQVVKVDPLATAKWVSSVTEKAYMKRALHPSSPQL